MSTLYSFNSAASLALHAAEHWIEIGQQAIKKRGLLHIALSGGSTPKQVHQIITDATHVNQLDWSKVHFYFGDERCVPPQHADSNYRMANETLFSKIPCPPENIHRMQGEIDPASAAQDYAKMLQAHLPRNNTGEAFIDIVLLGMGPDGHTASLFPDTAALKVMHKSVTENYVAKLHAWRITLTYPMFNAAHNILILAHGEEKNLVLKRILASPTAHDYPIQDIQPNGKLFWYLDDKASKNIDAPIQHIQE